MRRNDRLFRSVGRKVLLLVFFCAFPLSSHAQNEIKISYIGNMGVLIGNREKAVLIDGFHREYKPQYLFPSKALVEKLIKGEHADFGTIDVAMATHRHKDHFDPTYFHSFLDLNDTSIAVLSPQVKTILETATHKDAVDLNKRIWVANYDGAVHEFDHKGIEIKTFQIDHVNPSRHKSVENTAYLIHIAGISVLHIGDSDWSRAERHLKAHRGLLKQLDVAIMPYWMLLAEHSAERIERLIDPKKIIATHIPPDLDEGYKSRISENVKNTFFFTEMGETIVVSDHP